MALTMTIEPLLGLVAVLLLLLWSRSFLRPSLRLPPGPRPLPLLGNLLLMKKFGSIHDLANELKRKYGPIVTLWIGSKPLVLISGPDVIQEAMITKGGIFIGRQPSESVRVITYDHRALAISQGERHRFLRKLLVSELLTNKRMVGFKSSRDEEMDIMIETLKNELKGGIVTNFRAIIRSTICNLVMGVLFERRLTQEEYMEVDYLILQRHKLAVEKPRNYFPWLKWLLPDSEGIKFQLYLRGRLEKVLKPPVEERREALKSGKANPRPFVDTLLRLQSGEIHEKEIEIRDTDIPLLCFDIFSAGTDTSATNLEYCIGNLINHPEIQEKLANEISNVVGNERVVVEDDLPRLPYLQAVVKEALRRHNPARLSPPRTNLQATKLAGYDIPVNTGVLQHLEGVSLSPEIWEDPLEFRPERHLNRSLDITGSTEVTMIPFGVGRRMCPAINLAFLHAELILGRLVQAFEWKPAICDQLVDLTPGGVLTSPMKYPLVASLNERSV